MKHINILLIAFIFSSPTSINALDSIVVDIGPKSATVFLNGAQLTRENSQFLNKGVYVLQYEKLSPFLEDESIQYKLSEGAILLGISSNLNYEQPITNGSYKEYQVKNDSIANLISQIGLEQSIVQEKIAYLRSNRSVLTNNKDLNIEDWKSAELFHDKRLELLLSEQFDLENTKSSLNAKMELNSKIMQTLIPVSTNPTKTIYCTIEVEKSGTIQTTLQYYTPGAYWVPSYDFKVSAIDEPMIAMYKAKISQQTRENWKDVKLVLSTANPRKNNVIPHLKKYSISYGSKPPKYDYQRTVYGSVDNVVVDSDGLPLIGANVIVENTTIGTITDLLY